MINLVIVGAFLVGFMIPEFLAVFSSKSFPGLGANIITAVGTSLRATGIIYG